ncbi:TlpA family protein disulfide reductase [Mucilaginibacter litoreus]|uniref:TlpA family protein disulfide reductase n=1 Tax=Mucilaginibacter litoreus TaxID=1048221 RepID=A0ABW3AWM9_9SPHI
MKKTTLNIVLAVHCFFFSATAQDKSTASGLRIGDQVPDVIINNIINYKDANGQPATTAKISDFKGKLLILDFWATWCSPCVAMIPKMDSLQTEFSGKLQFLSVTYQSEKESISFLKKLEKQKSHHYNLPNAVADEKLSKLFPHTYLPHYVWIDASGKVKAITGFQEVSYNNIKKAIEKQYTRLAEKTEAPQVAFDKSTPLLIDGNGGDKSKLLYHSILCPYIDGLELAGDFSADSLHGRKISIRNANLAWLYQVAYSENGHVFNEMNTVFAVADSSRLTSSKVGKAYRDWLQAGNGFCYELIIPPAIMKQGNKIMQQDLLRYFSRYSAQIEQREEYCLVLKRTSSTDKLKSSGGKPHIDLDRFGYQLHNTTIGNLLYRLNFTQRTPLYLIDETGYNGKVDLTIQASLPDVSAVNKELERYDLTFEKSKRKREVLVIRDTQ